jgi:hypothetical protein
METKTESWEVELLDWVSACQSAYLIDNTPGHRFGWLPSRYAENRAALVEFVRELLAAAAEGADRNAMAKAMADRFLGWKLPHDFAPDAGVSFLPRGEHVGPFWPSGTNLLNAAQALEMFRYCMPDGAAQAKAPGNDHQHP